MADAAPNVEVESAPEAEAEVEVQDTAEGSGETEAQASAEDADAGEMSTDNEEAESGDKPGVKQAKSIFAQLHDEEFGEKPPTPDELPEGIKPESRAAKDIISLRQRAQRAEQEVTNFQTVMQQRDQEVGSYLANLQQTVQQMREENAALKARYEVLSQHQAPGKEENPYVNELLSKFDNDVLAKRLAPIEQRLGSVAQENKQLRSELQQREEQAQRAVQVANIRKAASQHFFSSVMRGVPQTDAAELAGIGSTMVMAMQRAISSEDPAVASANLRRFILKAADVISRNAKVGTKQSLEKGKEAATVVSRGGTGGKAKEPMPTQEQLVADGRYMTPWEYIEAGRPKLRNQPRR